MAAHIMVTNWVVETEVTRAKRLHCLVMDYLGVVSDQLPGPCFLDTGSLEEQIMRAARNCPYPPALSSILEVGMMSPVTLLCLEVMRAALASSHEEFRLMKIAPHTAPDIRTCLPL